MKWAISHPSFIRRLENKSKKILRIINGYIAYLKRSKVGADEPGAIHGIQEEPALYSIGNTEDPIPTTSQ